MKKCESCARQLPITAFAKHKGRSDGLQGACRQCCAAYRVLWRLQNIEKIKSSNREYARANAERMRAKTRAWIKANPERKKAADRAYNEKNKDKIRATGAAWRAKHKEELRATKKSYADANREKLRAQRTATYWRNVEANRNAARVWAAANPEKRRAQHAKRKATKISATPPWADFRLIDDLYAYCDFLTKTTGVPHQVDHIIPLRSRVVCGLHTFDNLQVLTGAENMRKGNRFPFYEAATC